MALLVNVQPALVRLVNVLPAPVALVVNVQPALEQVVNVQPVLMLSWRYF